MDEQKLKSKWNAMSIEEKIALLSESDKAYLRMFLNTTSPDFQNLTNREREVFSMLLTDKPPKEIATTLRVSYYTIDFHRKNLYRKLGIQSRAELFARYSCAAVPV